MKLNEPEEHEVRAMILSKLHADGWTYASNVAQDTKLASRLVWPVIARMCLDGTLTTQRARVRGYDGPVQIRRRKAA